MKRLMIFIIIIIILLIIFLVIKCMFNPFSNVAKAPVGANNEIGLKISLDDLKKFYETRQKKLKIEKEDVDKFIKDGNIKVGDNHYLISDLRFESEDKVLRFTVSGKPSFINKINLESDLNFEDMDKEVLKEIKDLIHFTSPKLVNTDKWVDECYSKIREDKEKDVNEFNLGEGNRDIKWSYWKASNTVHIDIAPKAK